MDGVKVWGVVARERLVEIARDMRRYPWIVEVSRQRPAGILNPYGAEAYVAKDGSEALVHPVEGVLHPKRCGEGGKAGAGAYQT